MNFILCKQLSDQLTADEISLKFETSVLLYCHPVFEFQSQLMFGSLTKIPVRQLKILILNPLSLLVYNKNMSAYYMYIVVGMLQLGIHT